MASLPSPITCLRSMLPYPVSNTLLPVLFISSTHLPNFLSSASSHSVFGNYPGFALRAQYAWNCLITWHLCSSESSSLEGKALRRTHLLCIGLEGPRRRKGVEGRELMSILMKGTHLCIGIEANPSLTFTKNYLTLELKNDILRRGDLYFPLDQLRV